jgi:hypothetical protein
VFVGIATVVAAIPVAGFVGLALAAAVDRDVRAGRNISMEDGVVGAAISFALFAPVVVGLGIAVSALVGVRSRLARFAAPLALIVTLCLPATLLVIAGSPDPSPIERRDLPLLGRIAPPPGATSDPATTFNDSGEWESVSWVTRRFDELAPQTTVRAARHHYIAEMQTAGWLTRVADSEDVTFISGRRGDRQVTIEVPHDSTRPVRVTLH